MIKPVFLIAIGGAIGSVFRYLLSTLLNKNFQISFPAGTFIVNSIGCLLIGLLFGVYNRYNVTNPNYNYFFITGFCGGFTTFSTFAAENIMLLNSGNWSLSITYIAASVIIGLLFVWLGQSLVVR